MPNVNGLKQHVQLVEAIITSKQIKKKITVSPHLTSWVHSTTLCEMMYNKTHLTIGYLI